jgi:hypothetical protein
MALPEIEKTEWGDSFSGAKPGIMGHSGRIVLLEK